MSSIATREPGKPQVSADAALRIARLDAEQKYRDPLSVPELPSFLKMATGGLTTN